MNYHLICVHPNGKYIKGQKVTDSVELAAIAKKKKEHFFVKIAAPAKTQVPAK